MGVARGSDLRLVALSDVDNLLYTTLLRVHEACQAHPHKEVVTSPIHFLSLPNDLEVSLSPSGRILVMLEKLFLNGWS